MLPVFLMDHYISYRVNIVLVIKPSTVSCGEFLHLAVHK